MTDTKKERAAFEKWVSDSGRAHMLARWKHGAGCYEDLTVHAWWSAWLGRAQLAAAPVAAQEPLADCRESCGYIGAECDFPLCKAEAAQGERQPDPECIYCQGSGEVLMGNRLIMPCKCKHA